MHTPPDAINGEMHPVQYVAIEQLEQLLITLLQRLQIPALSNDVILHSQRLLELSERNKAELHVKQTDPLQVRQFPIGVEQG